MKRIVIITGVFLALLAFLVPSIPIAASGPVNPAVQKEAPRIPIRLSTSSNWSGYAVETNLRHPQNNAVNDVKGSWKVPEVTPSNSTFTGTTYSACWIGIDGYSDNTVEQIGTEQDYDASTGQASYSAWYEMYPGPMVPINKPVNEGDTMSAEVSYGNGQFTLTLIDTSTTHDSWTYTTTQTLNSAKRQSAEWIVEAPWMGGVLPLANFDTVYFSNVSFNNTTITNSSWPNDPINMNDTTTPAATATPGSLSFSSSGDSFSVGWSLPTTSPPPHGHGNHGGNGK